MNLKHTQQSHSHGEHGFTLMETAISLVILMVVGLGAASLFFYSANNNTSARDRQLAMVVAQQQMEKLRSTTFGNLSVANAGGSPKTVTSAGRSYRVTTAMADTSSTLKTITLTVVPLKGNALTSQNFGGVSLVTQRAKS